MGGEGGIAPRDLDGAAVVENCLRVCEEPPRAGPRAHKVLGGLLARFPEIEMARKEVDRLIASTVERLGDLGHPQM